MQTKGPQDIWNPTTFPYHLPPPRIPACRLGLARSGPPGPSCAGQGGLSYWGNTASLQFQRFPENHWEDYRGQQEECQVHSPTPEPRLPPCQQPAQFKGKLESQAPVRCSHIQRWARREGRQGPLLGDRAGSLGTGQWARQLSRPGFKSLLCLSLSVWTWANHSVSPSLSFHFCKMGINNHQSRDCVWRVFTSDEHFIIITAAVVVVGLMSLKGRWACHSLWISLSQPRDTWKIPRRGSGYSLLYSWLENSTRQRSVEGYSPWGGQELDTTERLTQGLRLTVKDLQSHTHMGFSRHTGGGN